MYQARIAQLQDSLIDAKQILRYVAPCDFDSQVSLIMDLNFRLQQARLAQVKAQALAQAQAQAQA